MEHAGDPRLEARVGTTLADRYRLGRVLGAGGMGAVYEAEHTWTQRRVAVKVLAVPAGGAESQAVARFLREARAATRVAHPNVVQVLDMGMDEPAGVYFIAQEFLDGCDLARHLRDHGALSARAALEIVLPMLGGLAAAHSQGVVHRDLKPSNVFLVRRADGRLVPKLIDFGIARIDAARERDAEPVTNSGAIIGTPLYMAPEQARSARDAGPLADVWAAGAVLYHCLAGATPFEGESHGEVLARILSEDPPRLDARVPTVPAGLADAVHRAMSREKRRRFDGARAFAEALLALPELANEPWMASLRAQVVFTPEGEVAESPGSTGAARAGAITGSNPGALAETMPEPSDAAGRPASRAKSASDRAHSAAPPLDHSSEVPASALERSRPTTARPSRRVMLAAAGLTVATIGLWRAVTPRPTAVDAAPPAPHASRASTANTAEPPATPPVPRIAQPVAPTRTTPPSPPVATATLPTAEAPSSNAPPSIAAATPGRSTTTRGSRTPANASAATATSPTRPAQTTEPTTTAQPTQPPAAPQRQGLPHIRVMRTYQ